METEFFQILFRKWVDWCNQQHSDPILGPISYVVSFLAHLFKEAYQYCSVNAYCSAISSVHEKADGYIKWDSTHLSPDCLKDLSISDILDHTMVKRD